MRLIQLLLHAEVLFLNGLRGKVKVWLQQILAVWNSAYVGAALNLSGKCTAYRNAPTTNVSQ